MLYLFVEGPDDERFFSIIYGRLFGYYQFIQYSGWPQEKINNFLCSIQSMPESDYIFLGDADGKTIEQTRKKLMSKYSRLDSNHIFVVQYEIESWYYAGASEDVCRKLKLKHYIFNTDSLTKEQLYDKMPKRADRKFIMAELLDMYEVSLAIKGNKSIAIFHSSVNMEPI